MSLDVHFTSSLLNPSSSTSRVFGREVSSYNQLVSSKAGYDSAVISLKVNKNDMVDLAQWLIGREVAVYIDTLQIWTGIVNQVDFSNPAANLTVGPYLDIVNRVLVSYTDYSTGVPGITTYANDTPSQSRYGILTKILNGGSISSTNAGKIRNRFLFENRYPKINKSISTISDISFTINCIGHYYLLDTYLYNNSASGSTTLSTKIKSILAANPNSSFSIDYNNIETNTLSVGTTENNNRVASDIIKELISLGDDTTDNKVVFGLYGRKASYKTVVNTVEYYLDIAAKQINISNKTGRVINPWEIKPGYFVEILSTLPYSSKLVESSTISLIDSISYTYPYEFQISSGDSGTLSQQLAKLGISGL